MRVGQAALRWWTERVRWSRIPWRGCPVAHLPGWFRTVDEWGNRGVGVVLPLVGSFTVFPRARLGRDRWFWVSACEQWVTYRSPDGRVEARVPRGSVPSGPDGQFSPLPDEVLRRLLA